MPNHAPLILQGEREQKMRVWMAELESCEIFCENLSCKRNWYVEEVNLSIWLISIFWTMKFTNSFLVLCRFISSATYWIIQDNNNYMVALICGGKVSFKLCSDLIGLHQQLRIAADIICWCKQSREHPQSQNKLQAFLVASDFICV